MTTLTCRDGAAILMDYLEGALPADEKEAVDVHIAGCRKCVEFVRAYRETPRIIRDSTAFEMPAELVDSLRSFLARRTRGS